MVSFCAVFNVTLGEHGVVLCCVSWNYSGD